MPRKQDSEHPHQFRSLAVETLHSLEDTAIDAYHAIEDHDAKELRQDVTGMLAQLKDWWSPKAQSFKTWYEQQALVLKILYGLTLVPIVLVLGLAMFFLVKFGGPILLFSALAFKLLIAVVKTLFFIGYIGYKILKTILMWYYTISRLYLGNKAKRKRFSCAEKSDFPIVPASEKAQLTFHCKGKNLYIQHHEKGEIRILFSYLRYALIGQKELLDHALDSWRDYLTLWRQISRERIKTQLLPVGASMFSPHTLGAQVNDERILVPGDAELVLMKFSPPGAPLAFEFEVYWLDWEFKLRKSIKFLAIKRKRRNAVWQVESEFKPLAGPATDGIGADR